MRNSLLRCALLGLIATLAGGCSAPLAVHGKVISGDVSFIGVVDEADSRLGQAGLANAEIILRGVDARSDRILADSRSDKNGDFKVKITEPDAASYPALFHVHLPGYADARQPLAIPPPQRRVLVVLKAVGPAPSK